MLGLSYRRSNCSRNRVEKVGCPSPGSATEDVAREHRDFDNRVDGGQVHDHQHGRYLDEIGWRDESRYLGVDDAEGELADDVEDACGHDLVERILNECL